MVEPTKDDLKWRINASLKMVEIFIYLGILISLTFLVIFVFNIDKYVTNILFLFLLGGLLLFLIVIILYIRVDRHIFKKSKKWKWY